MCQTGTDESGVQTGTMGAPLHISMKEANIKASKQLRVDIDAQIQNLRKEIVQNDSDERQNALHYLQNAVMWLGMDLKRLGNENPYPNSYKPENAVVDPTAQNLKL